MPTVHHFNKKYKVDTYSYSLQNPRKGLPKLDSDVNIYTDGSKIKRYQTGAGICAYEVLRNYNRKFESWLVSADRSFYLEDQNMSHVFVRNLMKHYFYS